MMNSNYFSPPTSDDYFPSYDYSFEYSSPSTSMDMYSPFLPPPPACPLHSPHSFYTSTIPSMSISPISYPYQQQQQSQVYSPSVQQYSGVDRTPLRRHQCFKKHELQILHQAYIRDPHPSTDVLQQLAIQLKASIDKVRQWFKNRRHSDKQKKREVPSARVSKTT